MSELSGKLTDAELKRIFGDDAYNVKTHKDWVDALGKDELAFRLFGKFYSGRSCYQCVRYKKDAHGKYMCTDFDHEMDCMDEYRRWLDEPMEE